MIKLKRIISILFLLPMIFVMGCSAGETADRSVSAPDTADEGITAGAGTGTAAGTAIAAATAGTTSAASTENASDGYRDGTYEAQTEPDNEGYFTKAEVTIKDGKITAVDWGIYDANRNDKPFDEKYEEVFAGNDYFIGQSRSDWKGSRTYGPRLIETQDPDEVDAVSGATWTNNKFKEIIGKALEDAGK